MRESGPARFRSSGDQAAVDSYVGRARTLLGIIKSYMRAYGLKQLTRVFEHADGTVITVSSVHGQDTIDVAAPEGAAGGSGELTAGAEAVQLLAPIVPIATLSPLFGVLKGAPVAPSPTVILYQPKKLETLLALNTDQLRAAVITTTNIGILVSPDLLAADSTIFGATRGAAITRVAESAGNAAVVRYSKYGWAQVDLVQFYAQLVATYFVPASQVSSAGSFLTFRLQVDVAGLSIPLDVFVSSGGAVSFSSGAVNFWGVGEDGTSVVSFRSDGSVDVTLHYFWIFNSKRAAIPTALLDWKNVIQGQLSIPDAFTRTIQIRPSSTSSVTIPNFDGTSTTYPLLLPAAFEVTAWTSYEVLASPVVRSAQTTGPVLLVQQDTQRDVPTGHFTNDGFGGMTEDFDSTLSRRWFEMHRDSTVVELTNLGDIHYSFGFSGASARDPSVVAVLNSYGTNTQSLDPQSRQFYAIGSLPAIIEFNSFRKGTPADWVSDTGLDGFHGVRQYDRQFDFPSYSLVIFGAKNSDAPGTRRYQVQTASGFAAEGFRAYSENAAQGLFWSQVNSSSYDEPYNGSLTSNDSFNTYGVRQVFYGVNDTAYDADQLYAPGFGNVCVITYCNVLVRDANKAAVAFIPVDWPALAMQQAFLGSGPILLSAFTTAATAANTEYPAQAAAVAARQAQVAVILATPGQSVASLLTQLIALYQPALVFARNDLAFAAATMLLAGPGHFLWVTRGPALKDNL